MHKSVLLIGNRATGSFRRLKEEAEKLGIIFDAISGKDIVFRNGELAIHTDTSLAPLGYGTYFFRGMRSDRQPELQSVAAYLSTQGKRVVEKCFSNDMLPNDKDVPDSTTGIYEVPTARLVTPGTILDGQYEGVFPVVAKSLNSRMGRGVKRIDSREALVTFAQDTKEAFLLQTYYNITFDIRVLVIDGKALGAFKRCKPEGEQFLTTARGGFRERVELSDVEKRAAEEATTQKGLEIAGVDMFIVNKIIYIIEVNASPQFGAFEKYTGVNVAEHILHYIAD